MILVHYNAFNILCIILISGNFSSSLDIDIEIKAFDPAGRETSLLYDGGSVEISCWYNAYGEGDLELYAKDWSTGRFNHTYVKLETGNNSLLQHKISLQPETLLRSYMCTMGWIKSSVIYIFYNLCNRMSVEPRTVCPATGEFCHMKKDGSTECKRLNDAYCLYHRRSGYLNYNRYFRQVLPKFNVVCGSRKRTKLGLCYSLSNPFNQSVRFLTKSGRRCNPNFQFYICGEKCESEMKPMVMTGWNFVDMAAPFSINVMADDMAVSNAIVCEIAYAENKTVRSKKITFVAPKGNLSKAAVVTWQLKRLPTPTIADIVCDVVYKDEAYLRYQTSLLVFRSDMDLYYSTKQEKMGRDGDTKAINELTVNVTSADGLSVCVEQVRKECIPTKGTDMRSAQVTLSNTQEDYPFYVRLFASSPKQKYVLIHETSLRYTRATFTQENIGIKYEVGFIIAAAIAIMAVAVMSIFAVIWTRKRKAKQRRSQEARQDGSYSKLDPKSSQKDVQTSTTSGGLYLREVWTTTKSLYPKELINPWDPSQSDVYGTWKTSTRDYETINPKAEY